METKLTEKTFCKWEKDEIRQNVPLILKLTRDPGFVCRKCARVARRRINVCKPMEADKHRAQTSPRP